MESRWNSVFWRSVKSSSRHNAYKTGEPDKPIREDWMVVKLDETGQKGGPFVLNYLVKCGKHSHILTQPKGETTM